MTIGARIAMALLAAAVAAPLPAADTRDPRPELVVHLLEYLRWPADSQNKARTITLCVDAGPGQFKRFDELGRALKLSVPVEIRPLPDHDQDLAPCRIVYTDAANSADILALAYRRGQAAIVLIGSDERAIDFGADIAIPIKNRTTSLNINLAALQRRGIGVSSRLLRLANIVYRE